MPKQSSYKIKYLSLNFQLWYREELRKSSTQKNKYHQTFSGLWKLTKGEQIEKCFFMKTVEKWNFVVLSPGASSINPPTLPTPHSPSLPLVILACHENQQLPCLYKEWHY